MSAALVRIPEFVESFWNVLGRIFKKNVFFETVNFARVRRKLTQLSSVSSITLLTPDRRKYFNYVNN